MGIGACWVVACGGSLSSESNDTARGGTAGADGSGQHGGGEAVAPSKGGASGGRSVSVSVGGAAGTYADGGGGPFVDGGMGGVRESVDASNGGAAGTDAGGTTSSGEGGEGGEGGACVEVSCEEGYLEVDDGRGCTVCELEGCEAQRQGYLDLLRSVNVKHGLTCTKGADCTYYGGDDALCGVERCSTVTTAAALPELEATVPAYVAASCKLVCPLKVIGGVLYTGGLWDSCEPGVLGCHNGYCRED
jgi:hypothetical protein